MPVHDKVPSTEKQIQELKKIFGDDSKSWVPDGFPNRFTTPEKWDPLIISRLWNLATRNLSCTELHDIMSDNMLEQYPQTSRRHQIDYEFGLAAVYRRLELKFAAYDEIMAIYGCGPWPRFAPSGSPLTWDAQLLQALAAVASRNGPESKDPMLNVHIPSAFYTRYAGAPIEMSVADVNVAEVCYHADGIKKNWNTRPVELRDWLPERSIQHLETPEEWPVQVLYWLWKLSTMTLPRHCNAIRDTFLARLRSRQRRDPSRALLDTDDVRYVFRILRPKLRAINELRASWGPSHNLWLPSDSTMQFPREPLCWDTGILYSLSLLAKKHAEGRWRRFLVGKMQDTINQLNRKDGLVTAGIIDLVAMNYGREKSAE
ncbi:uncharacterized protein BKCO1_7000155 [Diplodia corticola]|uniref:Uncharacterized protein n=1 Tax=Diplodia corticola TaxID=236234 RepID=A0A1J9RY17_9PEZI|nr:uncharacterized protein BKCO1_7000155 [Diplodia corticola]OJD37547.1 hypothetical protein BKCO1_7000155 [Diplodia corticola]